MKRIAILLLALVAVSSARAQRPALILGDTTGIMLFADSRLMTPSRRPVNIGPGNVAYSNNATPATGAPAAGNPERGTRVVTGRIYAARGYRVQIYTGGDRAQATRVKFDFIRRFPHVRTYMSYTQPQFRVKVGDYKTRAEAAILYRQLTELYSPCMIVPDMVEINTFRNE